MNRDELHALIHRLSQEHKDDGDGGFALVGSLKRAQEKLEPEGRASFVEVLAKIVRAEEPELWAVALEVLVQLGESLEVATLAGELTRSIRDEGRKDYVVLGLLRLGSGPIDRSILEHIRASLSSPRPLTVPIIAALGRIDRDTCLEISSEYFEGALEGDRAQIVESSIPAFVRNFVANGDPLLPELIRRVTVRNPNAGRWLAKRVVDYLSKPWMIEELGRERCAKIKSKIAGAEHTLN